jgi:hypothetical protein
MGCGASTAAAAVPDVLQRPPPPTKEQLLLHYLNKMRRQELHGAFEAWSYEVWASRKMRRVMARMMHRMMAVCFEQWRGNVQVVLEQQRAEAEAARLLAAETAAAQRNAAEEQFRMETGAALRIQASWRGRLARRELQAQQAAASKIGSMIRGRIARRMLSRRKPGRGELRRPTARELGTVTQEQQAAAAATDMQAVRVTKLSMCQTILSLIRPRGWGVLLSALVS